MIADRYGIDDKCSTPYLPKYKTAFLAIQSFSQIAIQDDWQNKADRDRFDSKIKIVHPR